jgi:GT2 family glycosyltransferase
MTLSIIIPSFNTKDLTLKCLKSIESVKDSTHREIIVVDNHSTDGSPKAIEHRFPQVQLIKNRRNLGFATANNQGITKSRGQYLLLLNSDTEILYQNTFQQLIKFAQKSPDAGLIAPALLNPDKSIQNSAYNFPNISNAIQEFWLGKVGSYSPYAPTHTQPIDAAVMAALLIPRTTIDQVGLLDQRYFMYFEDLDYARRVKKASLKTYYLPQVQILHHHGASGKHLTPGFDQWKRLIPSSKLYHGWLKHHLINFIIRTSNLTNPI